jgi:hypothetical protein
MAALGRKNSGPSMHHNKDVAAPVPDCHIPAIRREFRRTFVLQIPCRPARGGLDRPTQLRTIRGKFIGNLRISLATLQRSMRAQPAADGTRFLMSSLRFKRPAGAAAAAALRWLRRKRHFANAGLGGAIIARRL